MTDDSIYARLLLQKDAVNKWMERFGVRFGIYKNGNFKEQIFPFDAIRASFQPPIGCTFPLVWLSVSKLSMLSSKMSIQRGLLSATASSLKILSIPQRAISLSAKA